MPIVPLGTQPVNQTTTVQYVLDQCKLHTKLQNYFGVGQITGEPGCGIATRVNQMLLQRRMAWKFNRAELSGANGQFFVTQQGVQDIRHAGACCFILLNNQAAGGNQPFGGASIDVSPAAVYNGVSYGPVNGGSGGITQSGATITIQTIDPHPFQSSNVGTILYVSGVMQSAYNSTFTWNALTQTSQWTNGYVITAIPDNLHIQVAARVGQTNLPASGAPGIFNLGWMESASLQDINSLAFPQPVKPIKAVHRLSPEYTTTGDILAVCALIDYNNGVIKFRLREPMGTYAFQINLIYQARAPKLTNPTMVFQWPDDLSYVLVEMALWQASRFAYGVGGEETMKLEASAQAALMSALEAEDKEENEEPIAPDRSLMR